MCIDGSSFYFLFEFFLADLFFVEFLLQSSAGLSTASVLRVLRRTRLINLESWVGTTSPSTTSWSFDTDAFAFSKARAELSRHVLDCAALAEDTGFSRRTRFAAG
jgi:hypothetical protein